MARTKMRRTLRSGEARKVFFSEERNQKTFLFQVFVPPGRQAAASSRSERLPFCRDRARAPSWLI
jgi:hypothetical protein